MAASSHNQENVNLNELSVEDKHMVDCLNQLDENETKIAVGFHQFLLAIAIKNVERILTECKADGKCFLNEEQRNRKKSFLTKIFYEESLKMLKQKLLEQFFF